MKKFELPKLNIHIKLPLSLWVIFLLIVLIEAFVLFLGLNTGFGITQKYDAESTVEVSKVDLPAYEETLEWVENRESYQLPSYELQNIEEGRENPFLE